MATQQRKLYKQQTALDTENSFEQFCQKNEIEYIRLDSLEGEASRKNFLTNPQGKCPDFWCRKEGKEIFVEVKTLTNFTNQRREKIIEAAVVEIKAKGLPGGPASEVFDPIPELTDPFTTFLKDASKKFKNIKDDFKCPRILFLGRVFIGNMRFTTHAIFYGAYDSFKKEGGKLVGAGPQKRKTGLFDETGSNVSAVVYWNKGINLFCGLENYKAKISFPENDFETFFGKTKIYQHIS